MTFKESLTFYVGSTFMLFVFACEGIAEKIRSVKFAPLPCNGILCSWHLKYTHVTCCYCKARRLALRKMTVPPYWIDYTYASSVKKRYVHSYVHGRVQDNGVWKGGVEAEAKQGQLLEVTEYSTLHIDPRGRFLSIRLAAISVLDRLMKAFNLWRQGCDGQPLSEVCELLSNYPK